MQTPPKKDRRGPWVGASEVPILTMGNRFPFKPDDGSSPLLALYRLKRGETEGADWTPAMLRGTILEPHVRAALAKALNRQITDATDDLKADGMPFLQASPDGWVVPDRPELAGPETITQLKTARRPLDYGWGDVDWANAANDFVGILPEHVWWQCQAELLVTRARENLVACLDVTGFDDDNILALAETGDADKLQWLVDGMDLRIYRVYPNEGSHRTIIEHARSFSYKVENGTPPDPQTQRDVFNLHPFDNGQTLVASEELEDLIRAAAKARVWKKKHEDHYKELAAKITRAMGRHKMVVDSAGTKLCDYVSHRVFDEEAFEAQRPDLYAKHCRTVFDPKGLDPKVKKAFMSSDIVGKRVFTTRIKTDG